MDDISSMLSTLELTVDADLDVWQWLEELPLESRILASGSQPGCMHMAPLSQGGHSGRRQLFVVGLDDGRYPKRATIGKNLLFRESLIHTGIEAKMHARFFGFRLASCLTFAKRASWCFAKKATYSSID